MTPIPTFQSVAGGVFVWHGFNPVCKADCSSVAIQTPGGLVFIDPLPLEENALVRLSATQKPVAVLLTNGNHERDTRRFVERFGIPLHAPEGAEIETPVTHRVRDGDVLFQSVKAIALPGAGPGETAYLSSRTLVVGDAVIHHEGKLMPLFDQYCEDPQQLSKSLDALAAYAFDVVCFAHGPAITIDAQERMRKFLNP